MADPANALFPFAQFPRLHVARFVILNDATLVDLPPEDPLRKAPVYLVLLGDCDGAAEDQLAEFATRAAEGLRQLFSCCANFPLNVDLLRWMQTHSVTPAAQYVNWVGRTVEQIREEAALHAALQAFLRREGTALAAASGPRHP